jgi:ketosteroid isomerase-like protein
MVASLLERFNSGKVSGMMDLYAPEAVFIAKDAQTIAGRTEIADELDRDLSLGLLLKAKARHVFVDDDIAQIVLDWSIDGTGPTPSTCASKARQATFRAVAQMDSGVT